MTVGENTADIAGIAVAYDDKTRTGYYKIGGYTPDQRFYLLLPIWKVK
jgi:putative endopeptidase